MPQPDMPKVVEWLKTAHKAVGRVDNETYFVGHSLGCILIARYLASQDGEAGGCVFVAGFSNSINIPEISEFYSLPLDIGKVTSRAGKITAILSDNDDTVPLTAGKEFAAKLGAKLVIEKGKGHFSGSDGIIELPSALAAVISRDPSSPG